MFKFISKMNEKKLQDFLIKNKDELDDFLRYEIKIKFIDKEMSVENKLLYINTEFETEMYKLIKSFIRARSKIKVDDKNELINKYIADIDSNVVSDLNNLIYDLSIQLAVLTEEEDKNKEIELEQYNNGDIDIDTTVSVLDPEKLYDENRESIFDKKKVIPPKEDDDDFVDSEDGSIEIIEIIESM